MSETELIISGVDFPRFSSRGCQQTLMPINTGNMRRTINGALHYLGDKNFHKYHSVIECQDVNAPAFNNLWLGSAVEVNCCQYIWQKVEAGVNEVSLIRPARQETIRVTNHLNQTVTFNYQNVQKLLFDQVVTEPLFIKFMPILKMRLTSFSHASQEWHQTMTWRIELEEI